MKNLILLFVFSFINVQIFSQPIGTTITGACTTVSVIGVPNYQRNLKTFGDYKTVDICTEYYLDCSPGAFAQTKHWLYKLNSAFQFILVQGPVFGDNFIFNGLAKGTYRVMTQVPTKKFNQFCEGAGTEIICFSNGIHLGWRGEYLPHNSQLGQLTLFFSNEVQVGLVDQSDLSFVIDDVNGGWSGNNVDFGDIVNLDARNSKNYTHWFLTIFEYHNGVQQRVLSKGWTEGQIGEYNLNDFWENGLGWVFETYKAYVVQFAIVNDNCQIQGQWTAENKTFEVCPGVGCKFSNVEPKILVYPNPIQNKFKISGLFYNPINKFEYVIKSIDGKILSTNKIQDPTESYELSGLEAGIYLINILKDGHSIYNSKISVTN